MRLSISKVFLALCALMFTAPSISYADIIEINPKPKARPKPKKPAPAAEAEEESDAPRRKSGQHFEMRIHMNNSQASRDLAPLIVKRMSDYGYGMAPDILYGDLYRKTENSDEEGPRPPAYDHTFSFEVVKTDSSCFLVTKVVGEDLREAQFRWETSGDGELPCELQAQQAMQEYRAKNPPKSPSKKKAADIEASFLADLEKAQADIAAKKEAAKKAEEEAAKKKREEAEQYRQQQEIAEKKLLEDSQPTPAGLGCSASSSAASAPVLFGLWAVLAAPLRRSFRRRG